MLASMTGSTISHYKIVKKLGAGGMGEVYLAQDLRLNRPVALKILPENSASDPQRMARFVQEAKAASALTHPNVAHIYEIGISKGLHFIAMQYVEGQTLRERLQTPMTLAEILDVSIQTAEALEDAHSLGIVHRDIKPANIMLTSRGHAKVLDFGLAKFAEKNAERPRVETQAGILLGTVQYMSPEQALGKQVDSRSDIFSLGVVMYEMATLRLPFEGDSVLETLNRVLNDSPVPITSLVPRFSADLERIIFKCLEKDPNRRYQSVKELLVDLSALKRESESGGRPAMSVSRPSHALQQRRLLAPAILIVLALTAVFFSLRSDKAQTVHSLAVLPFENRSADPTGEYLSDGITDETINKLSQLPGLKVLARATVFTYKGKQIDPRKVGRDLNVDAIVVGNVSPHTDELRVQVSLVNVEDGSQIWGEQYSSKMADIFEVQRNISNEIVDRLRLQLTGEQTQQLNKQPTSNVDAYTLYLQGRYYWNKRTEKDFHKAIDYFQRTTILDSNYAPAYVGLADSYSMLSNWGFVPAEDAYEKAKPLLLKAIALDEKLAEAHASLGQVRSFYDWDWAGAEKHFLRAIQLNPNYATAHHWYSLLLSATGRHEEAWAEIQKAQTLDPLSMIINSNAGYTLYLGRKYDEAIEQLQKTIELERDFVLAHQHLAATFEAKRQYAQSLSALQEAAAISPDNVTVRAQLARAYAAVGQHTRAAEILDELLSLAKRRYVPPYEIANVYAGIADKEKAFEWLEMAYNEQSDLLIFLNVEPRFDSLRGEQRFATLVSRLKLPS